MQFNTWLEKTVVTMSIGIVCMSMLYTIMGPPNHSNASIETGASQLMLAVQDIAAKTDMNTQVVAILFKRVEALEKQAKISVPKELQLKYVEPNAK